MRIFIAGATGALGRATVSRRFRDATGWVPHFADATIGLEAVAAAHRKAHG